jgi:hypothetical protein
MKFLGLLFLAIGSTSAFAAELEIPIESAIQPQKHVRSYVLVAADKSTHVLFCGSRNTIEFYSDESLLRVSADIPAATCTIYEKMLRTVSHETPVVFHYSPTRITARTVYRVISFANVEDDHPMFMLRTSDGGEHLLSCLGKIGVFTLDLYTTVASKRRSIPMMADVFHDLEFDLRGATATSPRFLSIDESGMVSSEASDPTPAASELPE